MLLGPLYHWSPSDRFGSIMSHGLIIGSKPAVCSTAVQQISFGFDPQSAWRLSGAMQWTSEIEKWDLWQVTIGEKDECRVRSEFGPLLWEVKVCNDIPAERVWFVGRRDQIAAYT